MKCLQIAIRRETFGCTQRNRLLHFLTFIKFFTNIHKVCLFMQSDFVYLLWVCLFMQSDFVYLLQSLFTYAVRFCLLITGFVYLCSQVLFTYYRVCLLITGFVYLCSQVLFTYYRVCLLITGFVYLFTQNLFIKIHTENETVFAVTRSFMHCVQSSDSKPVCCLMIAHSAWNSE